MRLRSKATKRNETCHNPLGFAALNANLPAHGRDELVYSST
jgi:hypothetical protein